MDPSSRASCLDTRLGETLLLADNREAAPTLPSRLPWSLVWFQSCSPTPAAALSRLWYLLQGLPGPELEALASLGAAMV